MKKVKGSQTEVSKKPLLLPAETKTSMMMHKIRGLRRRYILLIASGISLLLLLLLGLASIWVNQHSLAKVRLGTQLINQNQPDATISQAIQSATQNYTVTVSNPDGKVETYNLAQMGVSVDQPASIAAIRQYFSRNGALNNLQWWRRSNATLALKVNQAKFDHFIKTQVNHTYQPVKNAGISIANGVVTITKSQPGKVMLAKDARQEVLDSASRLNSVQLTPSVTVVKPSITEADLATKKTQLDEILSQRVSFAIAGSTTIASRANIANWLDLAPVPKHKTVDVNVNSGKVLAYINQIAGPHISPVRNRVIIKNKDGTKSVLIEGHNGTDVVNKDAAAKQVAESLLLGKNVSVTLNVKSESFETVAAKDYPKFIIVNVNSKRLYAYEHTRLVRTFLVSAGAPATPTVLGQFKIFSKVAIEDMRGSNADGSRYFQPDVRWVNYFYRDYAIHGNYWRPLSWFGYINSSHGCVGMPNDEAKWVYDWAPIGTPVIVHT